MDSEITGISKQVRGAVFFLASVFRTGNVSLSLPRSVARTQAHKPAQNEDPLPVLHPPALSRTVHILLPALRADKHVRTLALI